MDYKLIPTAEPFFIPGGPVGCLLVHGFTGTPKEMRWLGEYLAGRGHSVLGVRLAGHATRPEDMLRTHWQDWLASVEDGWHLLQGVSQHIFLMGLSMGGCLSLLFASRRNASRQAACPVAGVVAMSTPYALPDDWRIPYIKLFRWLQPTVPKGSPDWRNLEAARDHIDYPYYPTLAIAELRDLLAEMRLALPEVKAPVLLAHSRQDTSVPPANMHSIYNALGSREKEMIFVEDSGHVIIREPQRDLVYQAAGAFIDRVIKKMR